MDIGIERGGSRGGIARDEVNIRLTFHVIDKPLATVS